MFGSLKRTTHPMVKRGFSLLNGYTASDVFKAIEILEEKKELAKRIQYEKEFKEFKESIKLKK